MRIDRTSANLTFSLLGPVRAWRAGTEVDLGSPQQRTTLAMLLLREGLAVHMDQIVAGMWGEQPPRSAITTIRTYIYRLRATLERDAGHDGTRIDLIGGGYRLRTGRDVIDLSRFVWHTSRGADAARRRHWPAAAAEQRAALSLCGGLPLAGTVGPYTLGQGARLQQLVLGARLELMSAQIKLGRHRQVLPELTAMVAEFPLWEDVHSLLMTALYGSGRGADALEHYQSARRRLVDELGIEPGVRLRNLHQRILANDPALGAAAPPAGTARSVAQRYHRVRLPAADRRGGDVADASIARRRGVDSGALPFRACLDC
ncbi:BTAD domain-containing putative transcriptional regulator [Actinoplanes sp. NPDC023714]|uniref:AfsR/SARP family transcriptional regulator n=1 Tax=Actinoplanes sp. NPDC023714 TaxID=3154322 RepID=UPI0033FEDD95